MAKWRKQYRYGDISLTLAVDHCNTDVIISLLDRGCDTTIADDSDCIDGINILSVHPQSLYQKKDRAREYMSSTYSDITILSL